MVERVEHESAVEVPVRAIEIVYPDGEVHRMINVFCPVERVSLDPRICARCELCAEMPASIEADGASLRCIAPHAAGLARGRP
jgi:hypothetical protein